MGTGKEQKIRIEASTKLDESEINRMVKDAEVHADEDKRRKESVEARNGLDSIIFQAEKMLRENAEKLTDDIKKEIEAGVAEAKSKLDSTDLLTLKSAKDELEKKLHKLAEAIYRQSGATGAGASASSSSGAPEGGHQAPPGDKGNVFDAEYEDANN
jgi:molecular chaperone DnaK